MNKKIMLSGLCTALTQTKNKFTRRKRRTLAPPEGRSLFGRKGDYTLWENVISTGMGSRDGLALCGHK